jgi:hypothetical protein
MHNRTWFNEVGIATSEKELIVFSGGLDLTERKLNSELTSPPKYALNWKLRRSPVSSSLADS